ncbi:MAG: hypothetical protein DRH07_03520 [Deltaproteobacteria bacterium]|nr:MAG: hypothetical protein DRH07_03520 [Deltaproteobacteria bacterium]
MFQFDLSQEPLTNLELKTEQQKLKVIRKQQIKYSCISDVFHTFIFIALYFGQMLSGTAVMVAVAISTVSALILAMSRRRIRKTSDRITMAILAVGAAVAVAVILIQMLQQPLTGSLIAILLTGSIVIVGATLGRQIKEVMVAIEDLKQIGDDEQAQQELVSLCRQFPPLAQYREQAASYLRPTLTYGELKAMRNWTEE